ncbi:hypothetical protein Q6375_07960 [Clostridium septicum]|uniref:hypothetical protein n=1 Tax=Clostridium septicum TaxID=1504 RepID=UPI00272EC507|nr:hypothetical protein [Clostridium septicum]WLF70900.1 hypothetical protein Q6375_07960 [Clostridium septicum]
MLDINENINLNGNVNIENQQVVNMTASIYTEGNNYPNINITVVDKKIYKKKFDVCKQGINEFIDKALKKQYEMLGDVSSENK